ncbi:hypothetical protein EJ05DRAFT_503324 [Pseudovirgaria hyperparasitica]|uniref:Yeast cell wall synthesis Kre9/Knh1-like N-terminal domain-containing protein n=1 Tax=Pseudovirgaria hyperparasitica TaxID=470096 RepID=A0A6A6VWP2_9PEZI|nr:uncharacterized protein EJ05DRAFT_503324 [Pseudovirgaria hyperparasitica]KAF2755012.1 hypothetical protein EJ05DRAFT_503324 [Pseudovirgaria hyperparasitica]
MRRTEVVCELKEASLVAFMVRTMDRELEQERQRIPHRSDPKYIQNVIPRRFDVVLAIGAPRSRTLVAEDPQAPWIGATDLTSPASVAEYDSLCRGATICIAITRAEWCRAIALSVSVLYSFPFQQPCPLIVPTMSGILFFTNIPQAVETGKTYTIEYVAPTDAPVSITLQEGSSGNMKTVATLTSTATGGTFEWTVSGDLGVSEHYALQIAQENQIHYSGRFVLKAGETVD